MHYNSSSFLRSLLLLLALLACSTAMQAQTDRFDANFYVQQSTFGKKSKAKYGQVRYHVCNTYKQAQDYAERLKAAIKTDDAPGGSGLELDNTVNSFRFQFKNSRPNGTFTERVQDGMGVLILGEDGAEAVAIHQGTTEYNVIVQGQAAFEIDQVEVTAKRKKPTFRKVPSTDTGYEVSFNINAFLEKGITSTNTRLMVQPVIIDCQTDDTVDYTRPFVYEGYRFHQLQSRRMRFHYMRNDPVAPYYVPEVELEDNQDFQLDTTIIYRKKELNKDRTYKCAYFVTVEDYNHKIFDNGGEGTGSCLSFRPFKFLDFNVVSAPLALTSEFYDQAESRVRDIPRNLMLRFQVGTAELTKDSLNEILIDNLTREMESYGDRLTQIRVEGAASPEGSVSVNQMLAQKRALTAQQMIKRRLGSKADYIRIPAPTVTVHTWEDVAKVLDLKDSTQLAAQVRSAVISNGNEGAYAIIKNLAGYESTIVPILESQRVMKCAYQYEVDHVMDANEALTEYYAHKADYKAGRRDLSDGDYYNLFQTITDPAELDTLTEVAWRHTSRQPAFELLKFSPYVANRMALLNMRRGIYDVNVLRPFIDFSLGYINNTDRSTGMVRNRRELLLNQAINYFQRAELDTAQYIVDLLDKNGATEQTVKLNKFVTFVRTFFQANRTPAEEAAFQDAFNYVMDSSPDNRAIVYSELHNQLGKSRAECEEYIDKMDDKDPKKWYLKGLVWADEAGREPTASDDFTPISDEEYIRLQQEDPAALAEYLKKEKEHERRSGGNNGTRVPYYLAYFQHAFDLQPKYLRLYFNEGNVGDDVRKAHPYRSKDIPTYRRLFETLTHK